MYRFAVTKMSELIGRAVEGYDPEEVGLVVPHQVNSRIIESALERLGWDEERCYVNIHKYGNTSAATIPIALTEALEENRISPGDLIVFVAFGGGLTWGGIALRWGQRTTPIAISEVGLPPTNKTGLELLAERPRG